MEPAFWDLPAMRSNTLGLLGFVLVFISSGCSTTVCKDDGRFLCFPSPRTEKLCICFDMEESAYTYVATNDLPPQMVVAVQGGYIDDTSSDEHTMDREMEHVRHEKVTGSDVQEVKSLLLNLIRQVSAYQGLSKRSHVMSKRPFDSISYGSYFGGFGKK